jgi:hypothetical protein
MVDGEVVMDKLNEIYISKRINKLRTCVDKLPEVRKRTRAEDINYYTTLSRIDELLDLLPAEHFLRREYKKETVRQSNNTVSVVN